jgi:hypothetical protein
MRPLFPSRHAGCGFVLLEAMLAVAIFALGVLGLGRCISQGLNVERLAAEDARACRVLENRASEVEAGAISAAAATEKLGGINMGMKLKQSCQPLHKKDEHGQELANLYRVTLEAAWISDGAPQSRTLNFYVWAEHL